MTTVTRAFTVLRRVLSRVRVKLAVSFVLAGVVNLVLLSILGLAVSDMILGRGTVRLVESQLETFRELAAASAADLAEEFAWQAVHGRPSQAAVRERTAALHGLFPGSAAEILCVEDGENDDSEATLKNLPWIRGDDFVAFVAFPESVTLIAFARRTYGDCWADVVVRRNVDQALAERISEAIGLEVLPAGPAFIPEDDSALAWELLPASGTAFGGGWWPVVVLTRDAGTGERMDWLALQVRPDLATVVGQLSRIGQRQAAWVWIVPLLTAAVVLVGATSMILAARISNRIAYAIQDLSDGTRRFGSGELAHRIPERGDGELGSLAKSVNTMASDLQRLIEEAKARERLEEEMRLAREVQEWIYPRTVPDIPGAELAVECKPARMVTGDVYDFVEVGHEAIGILCADVSGKGVAAALLGASLHSIVRGYIAMACRGGGDSESGFPSPSAVVRHASEELLKRVRAGQYATAFWCDYDVGTRTLRYSNAGHLFPVLINGSVNSLLRLEGGGVPIGLLPSASYEERRVRLETNSLMVAFSDGITEATNASGEDFGEERLVALIRDKRDARPAEICRRIVTAVQEWQGDQEQLDDMTVIALRTD